MVLKDICRKDFLLANPTFSLSQTVKMILETNPTFVLLVQEEEILAIFSSQVLLKLYITDRSNPMVLADITEHLSFTQFPLHAPLHVLNQLPCDTIVVLTEAEHPVGILNYDLGIKNLSEGITTSSQSDESDVMKEQLNEMKYEIQQLQKQEFEQMDFFFNSSEMIKVMNSVKQSSQQNNSVLIHGEPGSGKELVAKSIHSLSSRNTRPFIKFNCRLTPVNIMEAELFGYEANAFPGAAKGGKKGKVELAGGGTLYLDEVGNIPFHVQQKLANLIKSHSYVRLGDPKTYYTDVRVIFATNMNLNDMVIAGSFRIDLFSLLDKAFAIQIPALRNRTDDIPLLADHFIKKFNSRYNLNRQLSPKVIEEMYHYSWPGNLKEFEFVLENIIVISQSDIVDSDTFRKSLTQKDTPSMRLILNGILPYKEAKGILEKQLVKMAFEIHGSTYKAAAVLGIDQSTVSKLLKKYRTEDEAENI